jgi:hypothetical protein
MNLESVIISTLTSSALTTVIIILIGYAMKSLFIHVLSLDIEKYKAELNIELEKLRVELGKVTFEYQTRFASLHAKRMEKMDELHKLLVHSAEDLSNMANPVELLGDPPKDYLCNKAFGSGRAFRSFFEENRIYFSSEMCDKIDIYINDVRSTISIYRQVLADQKEKQKNRNVLENWEAAWKKVNEEIPPIKSDIESECRAILGILDGQKSQVETPS